MSITAISINAMPPNSKKDSSPNFDAVNIHEGVVEARLKLIDAAAKKSDRWWFLTLMMLGMVAVCFLYYDSRQRDKAREARNDAQNLFIQDKLAAALGESNRALDRNTSAFDRNSSAFESNTSMMRILEGKIRQ